MPIKRDCCSFYKHKTQNIYLGLKLDVHVSPFDDASQCFWFDENGVHDSDGLRFELRRKINKM